LHLGDVVGAKRQRDRDFAGGAVVGNGQEIVGGRRAGGAERNFIYLAGRTRGHSGNQVAVRIPERALAVAGGDVAVGADFVNRSGQIGLLINKLAVLVPDQDVADFTNGELAQRFMVAVFLGENVVIHIVGGVALHLPDTFGRKFKDHVVSG